MHNLAIIICQNFEVYIGLLSEITISGILYIVTIILWNTYISCSTVDPSLYGKKYIYFISRFVTIYIELYTVFIIDFVDISSLTIKSNAISYYSLLYGFIECSFSYGTYWSYFIQLHLLHSLMTFLAILIISGK